MHRGLHQEQARLRPECAVVLTDGYVEGRGVTGWPCPTLWGITTDQVSGVGKTVHVKLTGVNKLGE
jgi:hypothetical protein